MRLEGMTCISGLMQVVKFWLREFGGEFANMELNELAERFGRWRLLMLGIWGATVKVDQFMRFWRMGGQR